MNTTLVHLSQGSCLSNFSRLDASLVQRLRDLGFQVVLPVVLSTNLRQQTRHLLEELDSFFVRLRAVSFRLPLRECIFLVDGGADALVVVKDSSSRGRFEPVEDSGVGALTGVAAAGVAGGFVSEGSTSI